MDKRVVIVVAMLAVLLYAESAGKQSRRVNTDMDATDQSAYMAYAKQLERSAFHFVGDRARMPLYPALMAMFYRGGMSDEEFFDLGKHVGIGIGLAVVILAFLLFSHRANVVDAGVATLVIMFTVIVFKAPAFQADVLFYGLFLITFVLMLRLLRTPHLGLSVLAGMIAALTHLAKASAPPAVLLFVCCMVGQAVLAALCPAPSQGATSPSPKRDWIRARKYTLCAILFAVTFLATLWPYLHNSKVRYGRYFYNVSSTFYMWCDSWEEAMGSTRAHGDREGWPDMPQSDIPSPSKYFREHSAGQIAERLRAGVLKARKTAIGAYGYATFFGLYVGCAGLLIAQNRRKLLGPFQDGHNVMIMFFITTFFMGYLLLYAWYAPIDAGNRHSLVLALPALYLITGVFSRARAQAISVRLLGRSIPAAAFSPITFILLVYYLVFQLGPNISTMVGNT